MKNVNLTFIKQCMQWTVVPLLVILTAFSVSAQTTHNIPNTVPDTLERFIEDTSLWEPGDIIQLSSEGTYLVTGTIDFFQEGTVQGDPNLPTWPELRLYDNGFRAKEDSISITLKNLRFNGLKENGTDKAPYILRFDQAGWQNYNDILVQNVEAYNTLGGIQLYKNTNTIYNSVTLDNVYFHDIENDFALDPRLNAVRELKIINSTFANVYGILKNPYFNKDGTAPFGLVEQNILIDRNTIFKVGGNGGAILQVNDPNDGSITLDFTNNVVSTIIDTVNSRPFLINELAGVFSITNNAVHEIKSNRDGGKYVLDSVAEYSNVTVSDIYEDYPEFADTASYDLTLPETSPLLKFATDGGAIGDPEWAPVIPGLESENIHPIPNDADSLERFIENISYWDPGDTILLVSAGQYVVNGTIDIFQEITVLGDPTLSVTPTLQFNDNGFRLKEDSINVTLKGFKMNGLRSDSSNAPYALRFDQAGWYNYKNILLEDLEVYNFNGGVQLYKNQNKYYETVTLNRVYFHDLLGDYVVDPRLNVVEQLTITNSTFHNIKGFVKNVYNNNDGTKEFGTVLQHVVIDHNTFYDVVTDAFLQFNDGTDGSVAVDFTNNIVSTLLDTVNSRPFRINELVGPVNLKNSVFHNFETNRLGGYNLDTLSLQANVTLSGISYDDPMFADTETDPHNYSFPITSSLLSAGTDGGPIGDPRWFPEVGVSIVSLSELPIEGYDTQMAADVTFGEGADLTVTWSVSNGYNGTAGEATIDASTGLLSAITAGEVLVTATSNENSFYKDSLVVTIVPPTPVSSISLSVQNSFGTEVSKIDSKGGSVSVIATILPVDATEKAIAWTLSDESLVTLTEVNSTTVSLQAQASGELTITATATDGSEVSASAVITITRQNPPTGYTVTTESGETSVVVDGTLQMVATRTPEGSDDEGVVWSIKSGANFATISETGLLTAVSPGSVTVLAESADPQNFLATGELTITVTNPLGLKPANLATIYPNPTANYLTLDIEGKATVQVMTMSGQLMLKRVINNKTDLDVSALDSGLYILTVSTDKEIQSIKFTKK